MKQHLLVTMNRARTPGSPVWLRVDGETREVRVVRLPDRFRRATVAHGAALHGEWVLGVFQVPESLVSIFHTSDYWLTVLDRRDLSLLAASPMRSMLDVHSICVHDGAVYVVSTGTDELWRLSLDGPRVVAEELFWRPDPEGARQDRHHLNSVASADGQLFVSGFGPRTGNLWSTATDGFIENLTQGRRVAGGLQHPHSLAWHEGRMLACESRRKLVRWVDGAAAELGGYTRGLCVTAGRIWVGLSRGRLRSKSTGMLNNWGSPGGAGGRCGLAELDENLRMTGFVDLTAYGDEVYEVVDVGDASGWPVAAELDWRDAALAGVEEGMERLRIEHERVTKGYEQALAEGQARMQGELDEANRVIRELHSKLDEVTAWALTLQSRVEDRDRTILELVAKLGGG